MFSRNTLCFVIDSCLLDRYTLTNSILGLPRQKFILKYIRPWSEMSKVQLHRTLTAVLCPGGVRRRRRKERKNRTEKKKKKKKQQQQREKGNDNDAVLAVWSHYCQSVHTRRDVIAWRRIFVNSPVRLFLFLSLHTASPPRTLQYGGESGFPCLENIVLKIKRIKQSFDREREGGEEKEKEKEKKEKKSERK